MKCKVLMAALVITLLMGVRGFADPCDQACVDPCGSCNKYVKCDLFSGLKKLVNGVRLCSDCGPCDGVVACNPCDEAVCNPCDEIGCNDGCLPKMELGKRLRNLFASHGCCNPCDEAACNPCDVACDPCDAACNPCDDVCCNDRCVTPRFSFRGLFRGIRLNHCDDGCNPCDEVANCNPCDVACNPCDAACNPCDATCDPCGNLCCDTDCGPRGHLLDLPRISLKRLFGGFRGCCDDGCNPCDEVRPCDNTCCR